jgi:hypothetical protein
VALEEQNSPERQLLDKLRAERKEIDHLIAAIEKRLGVHPSTEEDNEPAEEFVVVIRSGQFEGMSRSQAAIQLLREVDRALTTPQIFEFLKTGGADMSNKNSLNALYTALKRTSEIQRVKPNTWGLKEWRRYRS